MVIAIHQPHFLPWIGYINKIANSDIFVILDIVQFRKNYYQNRALIKANNSNSTWLTVPLEKASSHVRVEEIKIAKQPWVEKSIRVLDSYYSKAPFYKDFSSELKTILLKKHHRLADLNYDLILWTLSLLNISTQIYKASDLSLRAMEANQRNLEICLYFKAEYYLSGKGALDYFDESIFIQNNIKVIWQNFEPSTIVYQQINGPFKPNLSFIDLLFNEGPKKAREIIMRSWSHGKTKTI